MKATGIVRRIDDLGRVVIPKEIRHNRIDTVGKILFRHAGSGKTPGLELYIVLEMYIT